MRLSEAVLLGDSLKKPQPEQWLSEDGSCGCAIGGALLAVGVSGKERIELDGGMHDFLQAKQLWPWLTEQQLARISGMYMGVADGHVTLEQLVDWIRSVEPEEAEAVRVESPRNETEVFGQGTPVTELASANLKNK